MLLLGSKDSNIYQIDINKGKLCVVYEGHWSKVNLTYSLPEKDILISVSESNIKVWDLQHDECIKDMNEHTSTVILCRQAPQNSFNIVTISQNYEYKEWNYTTGVVEKSVALNLPEDDLIIVADFSVSGQTIYLGMESNVVLVYE